jgi:hypothetical protein
MVVQMQEITKLEKSMSIERNKVNIEKQLNTNYRMEKFKNEFIINCVNGWIGEFLEGDDNIQKV